MTGERTGTGATCGSIEGRAGLFDLGLHEKGAMIDFNSELRGAAETDVISIAVIEADRAVSRKFGPLLEWLPALGADCCNSMPLAGMEAELASLAQGRRRNIALPGLRGLSLGLSEPVTVVIIWIEDKLHYLLIAMPDFSARQVELLLGSERRARRLAEQQLEAASIEVRIASLARERMRLARDLHDTLVHSIVGLLMQIRLSRHFLETDPSALADSLAAAEEAAASGLARARRAIDGLRLTKDADEVLGLELIVAEFARRIEVEIEVDVDRALRDDVARHGSTIDRIVTEALRNIERHSAAGRVWIRATRDRSSGMLEIEIRDDGRGFDATSLPAFHYGLIGMKEIAILAGGVCSIDSGPGEGTSVRLSLPIKRSPGPTPTIPLR